LLEDVNLTREGFAPCKPGHVAPEIASGKKDFTGAADLYSLGCVAYWMLTSELVFEGDTPMDMIVQHLSELPGSRSDRSPFAIPAELDRLILQLLAKDPSDRPASAEALDRASGKIRGDAWTEDSAAQLWALHQSTPHRDLEDLEMSESGTLVRAATR
jgi:serine/threonine-protein kinase